MTVEELEGLFGKGSVLFTINTTRYVPSEKQELVCNNCGGCGSTSFDFSPIEDGAIICPKCHGSGKGN